MLGESVVVTGMAVAGADWNAASVLVAALGFVAVGCLWWLYFDRVDEGVIQRAYTGGLRGLLLGLAWAYGHFFVYAGLAVPRSASNWPSRRRRSRRLGGGARAALGGGVALYLLAITALHRLSPPPLPPGVPPASASPPSRWRSAWPGRRWPRPRSPACWRWRWSG